MQKTKWSKICEENQVYKDQLSNRTEQHYEENTNGETFMKKQKQKRNKTK